MTDQQRPNIWERAASEELPDRYFVFPLKRSDKSATLHLPPVAFESLLLSVFEIPSMKEDIRRLLVDYESAAANHKLPSTLSQTRFQMIMFDLFESALPKPPPSTRHDKNLDFASQKTLDWCREHQPDHAVWWRHACALILGRMEIDVRYQMLKSQNLLEYCKNYPVDKPMKVEWYDQRLIYTRRKQSPSFTDSFTQTDQIPTESPTAQGTAKNP